MPTTAGRGASVKVRRWFACSYNVPRGYYRWASLKRKSIDDSPSRRPTRDHTASPPALMATYGEHNSSALQRARLHWGPHAANTSHGREGAKSMTNPQGLVPILNKRGEVTGIWARNPEIVVDRMSLAELYSHADKILKTLTPCEQTRIRRVPIRTSRSPTTVSFQAVSSS